MRLVCHLRLGLLFAGLLGVASGPSALAQDRPQPPNDPPGEAPRPAPAPAPVAALDKPAEATPTPAPAPTAKREPAPPAPAPAATVPVPRPGPWMRQHERFLERAGKAPIDLLFLGDSITAGWSNARDVWTRYYGPRQAANFGIGGDRTQHILWRLDNGEVDSIHPKVVVLMIGTNNIGSNSEVEVAEGVRAILDRLHAKLPATKVLLLGIFPRGSNRDKTIPAVPLDPRIARINARLAAFDDDKLVKYLDIGVAFLDDAGKVARANMPDLLHLTPASYQIWAEAMEPTLWKLLESKDGTPGS